MTSNELWTEVYDKGYKKGVNALPFELMQLWYYIDFTYYVDNGGAAGFLYNKSPSENECGDYFKPYLDCWKFFGLLELVRLVEIYNDRFLESVKDYNKNGQRDFDQYQKKFKIDELIEELDPVIVRIVWTEKNTKVQSWLDENKDRIQRLIQSI